MFKLDTTFTPKGDQPQAIQKLVEGLKRPRKSQVLLGIQVLAKPLRWPT